VTAGQPTLPGGRMAKKTAKAGAKKKTAKKAAKKR
jgi:hypothetical protein